MEPIITFGSESLILEMNPEPVTIIEMEPDPEPEPVTIIEMEPEPKKSWCSIS